MIGIDVVHIYLHVCIKFQAMGPSFYVMQHLFLQVGESCRREGEEDAEGAGEEGQEPRSRAG